MERTPEAQARYDALDAARLRKELELDAAIIKVQRCVNAVADRHSIEIERGFNLSTHITVKTTFAVKDLAHAERVAMAVLAALATE